MKKIILILILLIFVVGCNQQISETPKMGEEQAGVVPKEIVTAPEPDVSDKEPTKQGEVYNPETDETEREFFQGWKTEFGGGGLRRRPLE